MLTLTEEQLDALKELVNVGMGTAVNILNEMLESHIEFELPSIITLKPEEIENNDASLYNSDLSSVELGFHGSFSGNAMLIIPDVSDAKMAATLTGEDPGSAGLDAAIEGTLSEIGNIVINNVMGSICNYLKYPIDYSLPLYKKGKLAELLRLSNLPENQTLILVNTTFIVPDRQVEGRIFVFFEYDSLKRVLLSIDELYCK